MSIQKDVYKTISSGHDLFESPVIIRTWGQPCSSATFFRDIGSPGVPTRGNRLRSSRPPVVPSWLLLVVFLLQKMGALLIQNHNCYYSNMTSQFNVIVCPNWCLFFVIQEEGFYCILFMFYILMCKTLLILNDLFSSQYSHRMGVLRLLPQDSVFYWASH